MSLKILEKLIRQRFLVLENKATEKHNFDIIVNKIWDDQSGVIYDTIFGNNSVLGAFDGYSDEERKEREDNVYELIDNIRVLKNFKILKPITGKSFGKVFKMSNDRMLKLFTDSLNVKEDMKWYEDCYEKLFSGTANMNTLPVFDFGSYSPSYGGSEIFYVEMAELMPLDKWIPHTKRGNENDARLGLSPLISFYDEMRREQRRNKILNMSKEEAIQMTLFMIAHARRDFKPFTQKEAEAILGAFWEAENAGWQLKDTAARNMGVVKQMDPADPVVVIFDR